MASMRPRQVIALVVVAVLGGCIGFFIGASRSRPFFRSGLEWQFADAAMAGDVRALESLHSRGVDVNAIPVDYIAGSSGYPPILVASIYSQDKAVAWLIQNGANINAAIGPDTAISIAEGKLDAAQRTIDILKQHGAKHWNEK